MERVAVELRLHESGQLLKWNFLFTKHLAQEFLDFKQQDGFRCHTFAGDSFVQCFVVLEPLRHLFDSLFLRSADFAVGCIEIH